MRLTPTALALVLASSSVALASPAIAQYGASPAAPSAAVAPPAKAAEPAYKPTISKAVQKEVAELHKAVTDKDTANIPAKLAAALAKAKTKDDRYVIAQLQLQAAIDAKDAAGMATGIEAVLAADVLSPADAAMLSSNLGTLHYNAKAYDKAAAAFERTLQLEPNNVDAMVMLGETRNVQGRTAEAVALIQRAIATRTAAGQKPEESWYKRAVALAYNAQQPNASAIAIDWVASYPSAKNWRDAIRIYQTTSKLADAELLDTMRLAQLTGALTSENDYFRFANTLVTKGFPGEAKLVLEQGFAAKSIDRSKPTFSQLYSVATTKSQGDRASLAPAAKTALAGADARKIMVIADAYYGYGDYAEAVELYRAALVKPGADKDLVNLRLGMALARSGDKTGAAAALKAAGGTQSEPAKFWLAYLQTKA